MTETWEIDFYSRPILDDQGKKLWEVLICNSLRTFEFARFCSGSEANARWLQEALSDAVVAWQERFDLGADAKPEKIRFFRRPMTAIITRACEALSIPALQSRRAFALVQWLQERSQTVYPKHPGFQPLMAPPPAFEPLAPQQLPDALRGEGWSFVSLSLASLQELSDWDVTFREGIPLDLLNLSPDAIVPGMVIFSQRAVPLAGWMSGLEVAALEVDSATTPRLLLETGLSDRWVLAPLSTPQLQTEAAEFTKAKQKAQNVHFLAIQSGPKEESFAGFWLLQTLALI